MQDDESFHSRICFDLFCLGELGGHDEHFGVIDQVCFVAFVNAGFAGTCGTEQIGNPAACHVERAGVIREPKGLELCFHGRKFRVVWFRGGIAYSTLPQPRIDCNNFLQKKIFFLFSPKKITFLFSLKKIFFFFCFDLNAKNPHLVSKVRIFICFNLDWIDESIPEVKRAAGKVCHRHCLLQRPFKKEFSRYRVDRILFHFVFLVWFGLIPAGSIPRY